MWQHMQFANLHVPHIDIRYYMQLVCICGPHNIIQPQIGCRLVAWCCLLRDFSLFFNSVTSAMVVAISLLT